MILGKLAAFPKLFHRRPVCCTTRTSVTPDRRHQSHFKRSCLEIAVFKLSCAEIHSSAWLLERKSPSESRIADLFQAIVAGERSALARAITLTESAHPRKIAQAQQLLSDCMQHSRQQFDVVGVKSLKFRIGLTGSPGAGKSTFIETFGKFLTGCGHRVAVLTVDPSSSRTGGSIMADKTRMPQLAVDSKAFIRPSAADGHLGGVTRTTNDVIILCENAGYDVIIVETVGVGQSEYSVADMVDMLLLLVPPAAGDELQGIKRGIVEVADLIVVTKADGHLLPVARQIQAEYSRALRLMRRMSEIWRPKVVRVSAITKDGIPELWEVMKSFWEEMTTENHLIEKRRKQCSVQMWAHIEHHLMSVFCQHPKIAMFVEEVQQQLAGSLITPGQGADILIKEFIKREASD